MPDPPAEHQQFKKETTTQTCWGYVSARLRVEHVTVLIIVLALIGREYSWYRHNASLAGKIASLEQNQQEHFQADQSENILKDILSKEIDLERARSRTFSSHDLTTTTSAAATTAAAIATAAAFPPNSVEVRADAEGRNEHFLDQRGDMDIVSMRDAKTTPTQSIPVTSASSTTVSPAAPVDDDRSSSNNSSNSSCSSSGTHSATRDDEGSVSSPSDSSRSDSTSSGGSSSSIDSRGDGDDASTDGDPSLNLTSKGASSDSNADAARSVAAELSSKLLNGSQNQTATLSATPPPTTTTTTTTTRMDGVQDEQLQAGAEISQGLKEALPQVKEKENDNENVAKTSKPKKRKKKKRDHNNKSPLPKHKKTKHSSSSSTSTSSDFSKSTSSSTARGRPDVYLLDMSGIAVLVLLCSLMIFEVTGLYIVRNPSLDCERFDDPKLRFKIREFTVKNTPVCTILTFFVVAVIALAAWMANRRGNADLFGGGSALGWESQSQYQHLSATAQRTLYEFESQQQQQQQQQQQMRGAGLRFMDWGKQDGVRSNGFQSSVSSASPFSSSTTAAEATTTATSAAAATESVSSSSSSSSSRNDDRNINRSNNSELLMLWALKLSLLWGMATPCTYLTLNLLNLRSELPARTQKAWFCALTDANWWIWLVTRTTGLIDVPSASSNIIWMSSQIWFQWPIRYFFYNYCASCGTPIEPFSDIFRTVLPPNFSIFDLLSVRSMRAGLFNSKDVPDSLLDKITLRTADSGERTNHTIYSLLFAAFGLAERGELAVSGTLVLFLANVAFAYAVLMICIHILYLISIRSCVDITPRLSLAVGSSDDDTCSYYSARSRSSSGGGIDVDALDRSEQKGDSGLTLSVGQREIKEGEGGEAGKNNSDSNINDSTNNKSSNNSSNKNNDSNNYTATATAVAASASTEQTRTITTPRGTFTVTLTTTTTNSGGSSGNGPNLGPSMDNSAGSGTISGKITRGGRRTTFSSPSSSHLFGAWGRRVQSLILTLLNASMHTFSICVMRCLHVLDDPKSVTLITLLSVINSSLVFLRVVWFQLIGGRAMHRELTAQILADLCSAGDIACVRQALFDAHTIYATATTAAAVSNGGGAGTGVGLGLADAMYGFGGGCSWYGWTIAWMLLHCHVGLSLYVLPCINSLMQKYTLTRTMKDAFVGEFLQAHSAVKIKEEEDSVLADLVARAKNLNLSLHKSSSSSKPTKPSAAKVTKATTTTTATQLQSQTSSSSSSGSMQSGKGRRRTSSGSNNNTSSNNSNNNNNNINSGASSETGAESTARGLSSSSSSSSSAYSLSGTAVGSFSAVPSSSSSSSSSSSKRGGGRKKLSRRATTSASPDETLEQQQLQHTRGTALSTLPSAANEARGIGGGGREGLVYASALLHPHTSSSTSSQFRGGEAAAGEGALLSTSLEDRGDDDRDKKNKKKEVGVVGVGPERLSPAAAALFAGTVTPTIAAINAAATAPDAGGGTESRASDAAAAVATAEMNYAAQNEGENEGVAAAGPAAGPAAAPVAVWDGIWDGKSARALPNSVVRDLAGALFDGLMEKSVLYYLFMARSLQGPGLPVSGFSSSSSSSSLFSAENPSDLGATTSCASDNSATAATTATTAALAAAEGEDGVRGQTQSQDPRPAQPPGQSQSQSQGAEGEGEYEQEEIGLLHIFKTLLQAEALTQRTRRLHLR